jgi:hypothetical protein
VNEDIKQHIAISEKLFSDKLTLDSRNQEIAENFYIERADFTVTRDIGNIFADHLFTSYPLTASRDLSDQMGSMLRPKSTAWFGMGMIDDRLEDHESKEWMQHKVSLMRRAMYDPNSHFQRATKEGDRDYVNFGNCVLSVIPNKDRNGLQYRNWHLRDVAWNENAEGSIEGKYCKRKYTIRQLKELFGESCHDSVKNAHSKDSMKEIKCLHVVIPNSQYGINTKLKNISIFIDLDNNHPMEQTPIGTNYYIIPRWATISGSQYAYSPAMIAALPDARLFQDMTRILLEAGEKAVDPPMIATQNAVRSDISLMAGGITYVDADYDERLGSALRPLTIDRSGIPLGMELADRTQQMLAKALYLDKFTLPVYNEMTAYEAGIRAQEHIRTVMPIFEPIEEEYNAPLCQETFDVMWSMGWMGSVYDIPEALQRNPDYQFKFISPLSQSEDRAAVGRFQAISEIINVAASINPSFVYNVDLDKAGRAAIQGVGSTEEWLNGEDEVESAKARDADQERLRQEMNMISQGAETVGAVQEVSNG